MGGNVFPEAEPVPVEDLPSILGTLGSVINHAITPHNYLGSTGRVAVSGDVDLGFDDRVRWVTWAERLKRAKFRGKRNSVLVGTAQVDVFINEMPLLQFYVHHPLHSEFKGSHRNWLISALCPPGWHWSGKDGLCERRNGMTVRSMKNPAEIAEYLIGIPDPLLFDNVESILSVIESGARLRQPKDEVLGRWNETMSEDLSYNYEGSRFRYKT